MFQNLANGDKMPAIAVIVIIVIVCGILCVVAGRRVRSGKKELQTSSKRESDLPKRGTIVIGNAQHIGMRSEQQDAFGISENDEKVASEKGLLAVLADGLGGLSNGKEYAQTAVNAALHSFREEKNEQSDDITLLRILRRASDAILRNDIADGGCTFVACLIKDEHLSFISVGDSRISLMRNGGLIQLNREHIYGRELDERMEDYRKADSDVSELKKRLLLTSYIGKPGEVKIDRNTSPIPLYSGDKVVLMSDGIYNGLTEEELSLLLLQEAMAAAGAVQKRLTEHMRPDQDNLTIIVLEII